MIEQWPAMASSTLLSTTSQTRWCRPVGPVDPMYMPGRFRTASSPSRTVMSTALYEFSVLVIGGAPPGVKAQDSDGRESPTLRSV